ncbi:MAG TPA: heparan-alpha-glucosaminide N-acetyltransferase domain-containing protein [Vicinamibacterales bacterium]|nr:heparan-alpha-glucosaminide N-acetyltransferase domain-containing protein [Vicinamibacterales bacterium]
MTSPATRRSYLDVLRGIAVLIMIEAHVIDAWTRAADRGSRAFGQSLILGGFGAPLFLFLAGIGVVLSAGSKARRSGDPAAASRAVQKRGLQIFALAFLFRLQSYVLGGFTAPAWTMLKVDILNIMGPAMIAAAALWALARGPVRRGAAYTAAAIALVFLTPAIRDIAALAVLPDPVEAYLRPIPGLNNFTFFPWVAFVMAGAAVGVILEAAGTAAADRRVNVALGLTGAALAWIAYEASFLPPLDPRSRFWTTSASFFFLRLGLMVAALGAAWLWEQRPTAGRRWSPLQLLGRTSLFIYWVHVELVYGLISRPLHGAFSLPAAWAALAAFWAAMIWLAAQKQRLWDKYVQRRRLHGKLSEKVLALMF